MIEPYKNLSDTVPHEEYILCISENGTYQGYDFSTIVDDIRDRIRGDKLRVQEYFPAPDELSQKRKLIQNSVWILHVDDCLAPESSTTLFKEEYLELQVFLETCSYPDEAGVFLCIDDISSAQQNELEDKFKELTIAGSKELLVGILTGHFAEANPISKRGQKKILRWNEEVCDELGVS